MIMRNLLQAVEYLNQNGIVHRDLKPGTACINYFVQRISFLEMKTILTQ